MVKSIGFAQDIVYGKATCSHYHKIFNNWRNFKFYKQYNVCNIVLSKPASTFPDVVMYFDQELITESMAGFIPHTDLLARAQAFATEPDYDSDRFFWDFIKTQYILCSMHVVSVRSLAVYLRSNYPGQMQQPIALGIQKTK